MYRIVIGLKSGESINLLDDEEASKDEILQRLSSLYSINNIAIIQTKNTSVIIRPSDIASIVVEDVRVLEQQAEVTEPPPKKEPEEHIDIITDAD